MTEQYIVAHDLGTSADKAVLITVHGEIVASDKVEYTMHHPAPECAEQDAMDWWNAVCATTKSVLKKTGVSPKQVAGVTFSSQTQCLLPVDRKGMPLRRAFSWLDGRSADIIREKLWGPPKIQGYNIPNLLRFLTITGGAPGHTGKDQIGKLLWLRQYEPEVFKAAYKFLDAKDFAISRLTGSMVTSVDIAVIWWMLDTRKNRNQWHPKLCSLAGITPDRLAEVKNSADVAGVITEEAAGAVGLLPGTKVITGAGDLAAAALGSGAIGEGELHISMGTSGWVAGHFAKRKIDLPHYTGCIGSAMPEKYYLAMAHQETIGICLEWLKNHVLYHKDQLKKESHVEEIYEVLDQLAEQAPPGSAGLIFTPWMYGERCPIDDQYVRAGLFNIGLNHSREHIIRAVFEGVGFNLRWALETLEKLYNKVEDLRVIGGGAKADIWCQIVADIMNRNIHRVADPQMAGARGMALLASRTLGHIDSLESVRDHIPVNKVFKPNPQLRALYDRMFREFKSLYKQNKNWYKRMNRSSAG